MRIVDNRALKALAAVLPNQLVDDWHVEIRHGGLLAVDLPLDGRTSRLILVWAGEGFPQDVRSAIDSTRHDAYPHEQLVVVARRMSKGAREYLKQVRANWVDERGHAEIVVMPNLVVIRGPVGGRLEKVESEMRWTRSAGAVAECLLTWFIERRAYDGDRIEIPRSGDLADQVHWSSPQVAKVLQQFDANGWTEKFGAERGAGATRVLRAPNDLLSAWAGWYRRRPLEMTRTHAVWRDPEQFWNEELRHRLPTNAWALTGWYALAEVAPYMTSIPTIACYLESAAYDFYLHDLVEATGLREVESGSRVTFIRAEPHVINRDLRERPDRVVNDIRLYGDLLRSGVRGEDAAEHLRESAIGI